MRWTGYVVATLGQNMRTQPTTSAPVVATLPYGVAVEVTGSAIAGWYPILDGMTSGYVYAAYISRIDPTTIKTDFDRAVAWVLDQEGGYTAGIPGDPGGETNWGISKGAYPDLDIKALTRDEAIELYRRDYWYASGADALSWPMCLIHFDTAVQHGVGNARALFSSAGHNILRYIGKRLEFYAGIPTAPQFGRAWGRRMGDLLQEVTE